jgi:hypothetical protein
MQLLFNLQESIGNFKDRNCFYIQGQFYTYEAFAQSVSSIRKSIEKNTSIQKTLLASLLMMT